MNQRRLSILARGAAICCLVFCPLAIEAGEKGRCNDKLDHCVRAMVNKLEHRGWVGIEMNRDEGQAHYVIRRVIPDSPAADAGLKPGDELVGFNGIPYLENNQKKLQAVYYKEMVVGNTITYTIIRDGKRKDVRVKLASIPEAVRAQWIGLHVLHDHGIGAPRTADATKP